MRCTASVMARSGPPTRMATGTGMGAGTAGVDARVLEAGEIADPPSGYSEGASRAVLVDEDLRLADVRPPEQLVADAVDVIGEALRQAVEGLEVVGAGLVPRDGVEAHVVG